MKITTDNKETTIGRYIYGQNYFCVRFETFTAVTMKNVVFWDVAATCSRWFAAREFFYLEDGGDTFFLNVC
jgi:hypothetical protein